MFYESLVVFYQSFVEHNQSLVELYQNMVEYPKGSVERYKNFVEHQKMGGIIKIPPKRSVTELCSVSINVRGYSAAQK